MEQKATRILFVGNSHTYFNDMAYMLKYIAEKGGAECRVDVAMLAHGGKSLGEHAEEPEVRFNIQYGGYDYVVLQQVAHPFPGKEALFREALAINGFIVASGAKPVLYMTWAEKDKPWNQKEMTEAYTELAAQMNAVLCPAGLCWQGFALAHPEIELYDADKGHASPTGSYLTACVFYLALFHKSPVGLPHHVVYHDRTICNLLPEEALLLQQAAALMNP